MRTWHTAAVSRQNDWDWHHTRQLGAAQMAGSVALPSALAYGGFHGLLPWLVAQGVPPLPAWMLVASAMLGLLVGVAVHLLQREARVLCMAFTARAWLLPKMAWLGPWSWVINGSVFALYHSFQIWLLPVLLVASLFFAFVVYHSKSIWPAMLAHLAGNLVFSLFGLAVLVL